MGATEVIEAELVLDANAGLAEGPAWHDGRLWWVDLANDEVHATDIETGDDRVYPVGEAVGAAVPRASGGFVLATASGFAALDTDTGAVEPLVAVDMNGEGRRMNDGKCDRAGRFWAGVVGPGEQPGKGLYRLDPDLTCTLVIPDVALCNGLAWSADDSTMYYIDSLSKEVAAYDFDAAAGTLANRRVVATHEEERCLPDGMTIDTDDCIWVAWFYGACVRRYSPDGELLVDVRLPPEATTSCTFGGANLDELFITTGVGHLSDEERAAQPGAGGIFRCRTGASGAPTAPFGG